jgi:hypothetical protein
MFVGRYRARSQPDEVTGLKRENGDRKQSVAELHLRYSWLKKSDWAGCDLGRRPSRLQMSLVLRRMH